MASVRIIGKKGSKSRKNITDATGIHLYTGQSNVDAIINYGLAGDKLRAFFNKYKLARKIPMINKYVGQSKYSVVKKAEETGILVPETLMSLPRLTKLSDWIEKKVNSSQGLGIVKAKHRKRIPGKYYQRFISDRRYEFRVHAFLWIPKEDWVINKRVGPKDQIAWNFHQGGHFRSVKYPNKYTVFLKAKDISEQILKLCKMSFGAVDLLVDNNLDLYFIEVNSSPGFSEFNAGTYTYAMKQLPSMSAREIRKYGVL